MGCGDPVGAHREGQIPPDQRAVEAGVDIIVAQGWEAGGHVCGEVATLLLVPRVVDAVAPTLVVAAGGVADGRGMAAAFGAGGCWRFWALGSWQAKKPACTRWRSGERSSRRRRPTPSTRACFDGVWPEAPIACCATEYTSNASVITMSNPSMVVGFYQTTTRQTRGL